MDGGSAECACLTLVLVPEVVVVSSFDFMLVIECVIVVAVIVVVMLLQVKWSWYHALLLIRNQTEDASREGTNEHTPLNGIGTKTRVMWLIGILRLVDSSVDQVDQEAIRARVEMGGGGDGGGERLDDFNRHERRR